MNANLQITFWVIGSLLIGLVALHIAHKSGGGQLVRLAQTTLSGHLLAELAAFVFYVGIPFVALIGGIINLNTMTLGQAQPNALLGFNLLEWLRSTGIAAATVLFVLGVMWLMAHAGPSLLAAASADPLPFSAFVRSALYNEVHWAFYRCLGAQTFADPYWGAVLGFGLIGLEWVLHPHFRLRAQSTEGRAHLALQLVCVITSSALYLGAQNLWLSIVVHILLLALGHRWLLHHASIPNQNTKTA